MKKVFFVLLLGVCLFLSAADFESSQEIQAQVDVPDIFIKFPERALEPLMTEVYVMITIGDEIFSWQKMLLVRPDRSKEIAKKTEAQYAMALFANQPELRRFFINNPTQEGDVHITIAKGAEIVNDLSLSDALFENQEMANANFVALGQYFIESDKFVDFHQGKIRTELLELAQATMSNCPCPPGDPAVCGAMASACRINCRKKFPDIGSERFEACVNQCLDEATKCLRGWTTQVTRKVYTWDGPWGIFRYSIQGQDLFHKSSYNPYYHGYPTYLYNEWGRRRKVTTYVDTTCVGGNVCTEIKSVTWEVIFCYEYLGFAEYKPWPPEFLSPPC